MIYNVYARDADNFEYKERRFKSWEMVLRESEVWVIEVSLYPWCSGDR